MSGVKLFLAVAASAVFAWAAGCSGAEDVQRAGGIAHREDTVAERTASPEQGEGRHGKGRNAKSAGALAAGDGGYERVVHDTGALSAELPAAWEERLTGEVASYDGQPVGPSITASTDLDAWHETGGVPGVFFVASRDLAEAYTNDGLLDHPYNDLSSACVPGERRDFRRGPYSGRIQAWGNCYGKAEASFYTLVASPGDRECVAVIQIGTYGGKDRKAARRILDTFEVDCGRVPGHGYAPPAPTADETVSCDDFISVTGKPSQWQAQQFYDFQATPRERAILDPDGNGFACDGGALVPPAQEAPQIGSTCPPGTHGFGDPGTGQLRCLTPEELERLQGAPASPDPGYAPPPPARDGVCEGRGEEDPDCADMLRESMENSTP